MSVTYVKHETISLKLHSELASLRKLSVQHFDLAIELFNLRGNSQVCQSGGRFGVALSFCRELIRPRLKD